MPRAKAGESVRGYKLLKDFKMAGGGNCEWTFAVKDGKEYFIKVFLNPKYPTLGSPETQRQMVEDCERFEKHQRKLNEAVKRVAGVGGRLVAASDFFREDNLFYKVAVKVPVSPITAKEISKLPLEQKIRVLQNVATAITSLHNQRIVHGDLKLDNALLEKGSGDDPFIARLIDFDSSYFSGEPFSVDEMVGDPPYYSPELLNYIQRHEKNPASLTTKSDIFALGIVFHQYLTGEPPPFPDPHQYVCEAVRAGHSISPESLKGVESEDLANLISSMLRFDPVERPDSFNVQNRLKDVRAGKEATAPLPRSPDGPPAPPTVKKEPKSGLRGKAVDETKSEPTPDALTPRRSGGTTPPAPPARSPAAVPERGTLRISKEFSPKPGEVKSSTSDESDKKAVTAPTVTATSTPSVSTSSSDLVLPSTFRVALTNLIASLSNLETVVGDKTAPPDAPPRVKGSLSHAPRSLSPGETESLSDIALRLEDLQKYAADIVAWFKGETPGRSPLFGSKSDLEVATTPESAPIRVEVESRSGGPSVPPAPHTDIDDSTSLHHRDSALPAESLTTKDVHGEHIVDHKRDEPEFGTVTDAVTVPTAPVVESTAVGSDPSGTQRRKERLENRALGGVPRTPGTR